MINWNEVYEKIRNKESIYYIGGTLSVGLNPGEFVDLNLDGKGFDHNHNEIEQPLNILNAVRRLYRQEKGLTEHYIETVCK